ncbi:MAG TPA: YidC/Oxa1 family membrane protein insertase [Acidimicrobiales bacterium]|nr:YidC/Oxa1 family membrane protein insertase [Acidimicrobiales bacterium]
MGQPLGGRPGAGAGAGDSGGIVRSVMLAFWILDPIYHAMGAVLAFFYSVVASYGLAIALLTVTVRLFLIPLTTKQVKSQQAMQRIQPELKRLQAKYKNDRQKLNEEMMKFYKENKVNPLAGCLPILLQAPLFIVLYRVILGLSKPGGPRHVPHDSNLYTSLVDSGGKMVSWGFDLAKSAGSVSGFGNAFPYYILVALTVGTGYFQQRQMTARMPKDAANQQMQMVAKVFPVIIGFVSLSVPAGVVVYFVVSNLWQIAQQAITFKAFPPVHLAGGDKGGVAEKSDKSDKGSAKTDRGAGRGGGGGGGANGARNSRSSSGRAAGGAAKAKKQLPKQSGRAQPKANRPPPSPRPKGLPPRGKGAPGGGGSTNGNGTSAKNSRRKED